MHLLMFLVWKSTNHTVKSGLNLEIAACTHTDSDIKGERVRSLSFSA